MKTQVEKSEKRDIYKRYIKGLTFDKKYVIISVTGVYYRKVNNLI